MMGQLRSFADWSRPGRALLGKAAGSDEVVEGHEYAAPSRAKSLKGLPPTYIE